MDPYRDFTFVSKPGPKLFSPLRPFRVLFFYWLAFLRNWFFSTEMFDETPFVLCTWIAMIVVGLVPCVWFGFLGIAGPFLFLGLHVFVYYAFHLGNEESYEEWKRKLTS